MFTGSGEYRLDALAEIKVTDSYLGLDENVRECQNQKSFYECVRVLATRTKDKEILTYISETNVER